MLFKGTFVGEASGKLGGVVASRNKGGGYFKVFTMGTNPNTAAQAAQRAIISNVIAAWRALAPDEKAAWNQAGADYTYVNRVGDLKTRSGYQAFMFVNMAIQAASGPPFNTGHVVTSPPGFAGPSDLGASAIVDFTGGVVNAINLTTTIAGSGKNKVVVWATKPLSSGVSNSPQNAYRVIGYIPDTSAPGVYSFDSDYVAKFGQPSVIGSRIGVKFVQVNQSTGVSVVISEQTYLVNP